MGIKEAFQKAIGFRESQIKEDQSPKELKTFSEKDKEDFDERIKNAEIKEAGRKPEQEKNKKLLKEAVKENPNVSKAVFEFAKKYKAKELIEGGDFAAAYVELKKEAAKNGVILVDGSSEDVLAHTLFVDVLAKKYVVEVASEMVIKGEEIDLDSANLVNGLSNSLKDLSSISEVGVSVEVPEKTDLSELIKIGKIEALLEGLETIIESRQNIPTEKEAEEEKSFSAKREDRRKLVEKKQDNGRLSDKEAEKEKKLKEDQEKSWQEVKEKHPEVKVAIKEIQDEVVGNVVKNANKDKDASYPMQKSPYDEAKEKLGEIEAEIEKDDNYSGEDRSVLLAWSDGVRRVWRIEYLREKESRGRASGVERDELKRQLKEDEKFGWGNRREKTKEGIRDMVKMGLDFEEASLPRAGIDNAQQLEDYLKNIQPGNPMSESWVESQLKSSGFTEAEIKNFKEGNLNLIKSEWLEDTLFAFEENSDNPTIGQKLQIAMNYMSAVRKEKGAHENIEKMWQKISDRRLFMEYFEVHKMASGDKAGDDTREALRKKAETVFADEFGARRFTRYWKESFKIMQEIERDERYKKYLNSKSRGDDQKFYLEIAQAHAPLFNALDSKGQERETLKVKHAIRFWRMIGRQAMLDSSENTDSENGDISTLPRDIKGKKMRKRAYNEEKGHQALMRFDANTTKLNIGPTKETTFKGQKTDSKANELLQSVADTGFRDFLAKLNDKELTVYGLSRNSMGFVDNLSVAEQSMENLDFEQGIDSLGDDKKSLASRFSEWVNDTKDASNTQAALLQFLLSPTMETAAKVDYLHLGGDELKPGQVLGIAWDQRFEEYPEREITQREVDVFGSRRMFMKHRILWALIMTRKRDGTPLTKEKMLTSHDQMYQWAKYVTTNAYDPNEQSRGYEVLDYIGLSKKKALTERYGSLFFGIVLAFVKEAFNIK